MKELSSQVRQGQTWTPQARGVRDRPGEAKGAAGPLSGRARRAAWRRRHGKWALKVEWRSGRHSGAWGQGGESPPLMASWAA